MNDKKKLRRLPKRIVSFVLTLAMVLTLMPFCTLQVYAAGTEWSDIKNSIAGSYFQINANGGYEDEYIIEAADTMEGTVIKYRILSYSTQTENACTYSITDCSVTDGKIVLSLRKNGGNVSFSASSLTFTQSEHTLNDGWDTYPFIIHVTGVTLNKSTISLMPDASETLVAEVSPSNASYKDVTWSTSNPSVATVTDGVVTAVSAGTATITVTTVDGRKAASCTVTVITSASSNESSFKEPEKVFVDLDTNKSEVAYGTVFMHNKDDVRNIFDMKVHSVDARTKANQEFLAASYAKNQGKRARVLLTTGVYPRNKLAAKDIGTKKFLSFINLEKKIMPVYAVCYNQTDKAYYLTGTMNANGTAVFNDFIARDATNITIFVLE